MVEWNVDADAGSVSTKVTKVCSLQQGKKNMKLARFLFSRRFEVIDSIIKLTSRFHVAVRLFMDHRGRQNVVRTKK